MSESYVRPPTLGSFLDAGGDLGAFALLDSLVEAVVVARRLLPAETNRRQAVRNRRFVQRWFARHGGEEPVPATQELLTFALWKAECLEDTALAERFEASLPTDTRDRALQLVADLRHVHPLAVYEELTDWTCRACGEGFLRAPAAVVTNTGEELGYDSDLSYCMACMSIATSALETASGIDRFSQGIDDERLRLRPDSSLAITPVDEVNLVEAEAEAEDDTDEIVLDDEETVRHEAERLRVQLEASGRRMAALEERRAALIRRLEESGRRRGQGASGS